MKYNVYSTSIWMLFRSGFRKEIAKEFDENYAISIMSKAKKEYKEIILRTEGIGGLKNPLLTVLILGAFIIAVYKSSDSKISDEKMYHIFDKVTSSNPLFKLSCKGTNAFTKKWQDKQYKWALDTQKKRFKNNWVVEFVHGDDVNSCGLTYTECGICKLFKQENCYELAKQMCKFDFTQTEMMGINLNRTKTLANGDDVCDFWFSQK